MIAIKRPKAPAFLIDKNGPWMKEIDDAREHYKKANPGPYDFKMYNDPQLKDELKKVFVKCAYCDTTYGAVYDGDVEHFRPKGKVNEKNPQTPGYYWLANDWDNLYLACQHCNQRRRHILYGDDRLQGYGKLDQFPIADEGKRCSAPDVDLSEEEKVRLLLDPCKDNPEEHFIYEKEEGVIIPLTDRGKTSINVFVLQRPFLVLERKKQLLKLFEQMALAKHLLEQMNSDPADPGRKAAFKMAMNNVMKFTESTEMYAGMSRYFVKQFLKENNINLK